MPSLARRHLASALALLSLSLALQACAEGESPAQHGHEPGALIEASAARGDAYNFAPSSRTVAPVAVFSTSGSVTNPASLLSNVPATLAGAGAQIVLDFGVEVGGILSIEFGNTTG